MERADLTDAVKAARRGLKRDVAALSTALGAGALYLPLARALRPESGEYVSSGEKLALHAMRSREGRAFGAAFTRADFLKHCGDKMRWATNARDLQYVQLEARVALSVLLELMKAGHIEGVALNPFQEGEILLSADETARLLKGESFPMPRYIGNLPVQKDERFEESDPPAPPPEDFLAALNGLVGHGLLGYRIRRLFNAERDLEPHWLIRAKTSSPSDGHAALAQRIQSAIAGRVPPPGYIDILFEP